MAIIKCSSVHSTPMACLKYILNPKKNRNGELVNGWNCPNDADGIYSLFKDIFEYNSHERFDISEVESEGDMSRKNRIRIHHYIQSFAPGEVTPEQANEIGHSWARQAFGLHSIYVVSTHVDTDSIHNHIALCPYDENGKIWYQNKSSLKKCRELSDRICRSNGLSVIENPKKRSTLSHAEYIARKRGTSWKAKMCSVIDNAVCDVSVNNLDDFLEYMQREGYTITQKKYITIKAPNAKHGIRSYRLGDGYSLEAIMLRIEQKDSVLTLSDIEKYTGIAYECAVCLRQLQKIIYRQAMGENAAVNADYAELIRSAELLKYITDNNISSENDFMKIIDEYDAKYQREKDLLERKEKKLKLSENVMTDGKRYLEISHQKRFTPQMMDELRQLDGYDDMKLFSEEDIERIYNDIPSLRNEVSELSDKTAQLKQKRDEADKQYRSYLDFMENNYKLLLEHHKLEVQQLEKQRREEERQRQYDSRNTYRSRYSSWER